MSTIAEAEGPSHRERRSQREIQSIINEIGRLMALGMVDRDIMERLSLRRTQYFVYRSRMFRQSGDQFAKTTEDEMIFHKDLLHERLTRLFRRAEMDLAHFDETNSGNNKDRASTYLAAQNIATNIFKLNYEGLNVLRNGNFRRADGYVRRVSASAINNESGRTAISGSGQIRVLSRYSATTIGPGESVPTKGVTGDQNKEPDQSEIY